MGLEIAIRLQIVEDGRNKVVVTGTVAYLAGVGGEEEKPIPNPSQREGGVATSWVSFACLGS